MTREKVPLREAPKARQEVKIVFWTESVYNI